VRCRRTSALLADPPALGFALLETGFVARFMARFVARFMARQALQIPAEIPAKVP
jgi:hypothetical protein